MTAGGDRRGRWAGRLWAALDRPRVWIWLILGYCAAHFVLRLCLSPIYTLDEAEQVLFAQELSLGYRFRHPPLITWATYLTQSVFGVSLPSLAALKYLIMAGGFLALFQAGRLFLDDVRLAGLAVAAFWMTFTVGYYPHVDLMHTVALTSLLGAALWALGRLVCRPAPLWIYALAGAIIAAGTLSKYVFAIFPLAAGLALLFVPELRARLRPSGIALMVAVALALLAPYAIWTAVHEYSLLTLARDVAGSEERPFFLLAWGQGLVGLALALAMFVLPFLAIFAALFPRALAPLPMGGEEGARARLLLLTVLIGAGLMALPVFLVGATDFKARWMHQVLIGGGVLVFLRAAAAYGGSALRARLPWLGAAAAALFALTLLARILSYAGNAESCRNCWEYQPWDAFAAEIRALGFEAGTIVVNDMYVGGNLRARFPRARVVADGYPLTIFPPEGEGGCLVVWRGRRSDMPPDLETYLRETLGVEAGRLGPALTLSAPLTGAPERAAMLHVAWGQAPETACR